MKSLLEDDKVTEEQIVLDEARRQKIAAGPEVHQNQWLARVVRRQLSQDRLVVRQAAPQARQMLLLAPSESVKSGPPPAQSTVEQPIVAESTSALEDGSTFEDAGNGYFYRKMANGGYEQQIYIKNSEGQYVPYQAE